ncbi:MAG: ribulose-phosphate 3-epimerase [Clostridia bacterium]|jgi:ribulose-phosphate 3-epimerase|nr:ribulose-phosphate 3-epimerase [Clostridia bacterium]
MKTNKVWVAPSVLSADFGKMGEEVARMESCGADVIHCDVMDGLFVPNITFGFKMIADLKKHTSLPLDVHLMIDRPERYVQRFIDAGADWLTVHCEATNELIPTLEKIKAAGIKCGAVISPDTPTQALAQCFPLCDVVLLMSVYPGFGGQKFIEKSLQRMQELHAMRQACQSSALLEIDGGVNEQNAQAIVAAGADVLVAGNTLFSAADPREIIRRLHSL